MSGICETEAEVELPQQCPLECKERKLKQQSEMSGKNIERVVVVVIVKSFDPTRELFIESFVMA